MIVSVSYVELEHHSKHADTQPDRKKDPTAINGGSTQGYLPVRALVLRRLHAVFPSGPMGPPSGRMYPHPNQQS